MTTAALTHWGPNQAFELRIVTDLVMYVERANAVIKAREKK